MEPIRMKGVTSLTPRQRERHDRILACTRQQVARLGYDGVNMRDLAAAADVSTRTLYNLYENKDTLILAASRELLDAIGQQLGDRTGMERLISRLDGTAAQFRVIADLVLDDLPRWMEREMSPGDAAQIIDDQRQ